MVQMTPAEVAKYKKRIINPDGSVSTERSITIGLNENGKRVFVNIPSIIDGVQLSRKEAIEIAWKEGMDYPRFGNLEEAIIAAKKRSEEIGKEIRKLTKSLNNI